MLIFVPLILNRISRNPVGILQQSNQRTQNFLRRHVMNKRRNFLKKSILVAAGMMAGGYSKAFASQKKETSTAFPSGIVYTRENPGKWAKKVGSHAPRIKMEGKRVTITTMHPMSEKHYIVRHTLVSEEGKVLGEKTFYPSHKAVSTHELPADHGSRLYATSFCNLHDLWVTVFNV